MIARHAEAGREKGAFFLVDGAAEAAPLQDQVSPPRRPRGRPGSVDKPAGNKPRRKALQEFPVAVTRDDLAEYRAFVSRGANATSLSNRHPQYIRHDRPPSAAMPLEDL